MPIRIVIVDDVAGIRRGLRMRLALEPDLEVVGEARDGEEALQLVDELQPDVVIMDIALAGADGFAMTEAVCTCSPRCSVVVLSLQDQPAQRAQARRAGAAAFVSKHDDAEELIATVRAVAPRGELPSS